MPDQMILLHCPLESLPESMLVPKEMLSDLLALADVPDDMLSPLSTELRDQAGFCGPERLGQTVGGIVLEGRLAKALQRILLNVEPGNVDRIVRMLRLWREASPENRKKLSEDLLSTIESKLRLVAGSYPSLERYRKADHLSTLIGNSVESIDLICDLRPVFSKERDRVEGMIPLTYMRISYGRQNEKAEVVELLLSSDMLEELMTKASKAKEKLAVLRESVGAWLPGGYLDLT